MKKPQKQNTEEEEISWDKNSISSKIQRSSIAATHNKVIAKIIRTKSSSWSPFKTMLKRLTCLVMLLALLLLIFTCYTEGKKGNAKKKLSEQELDKVAEKLAKQMSKESKLESEETELEDEDEDEDEDEEETVEYIKGSSLRKPPKDYVRKRAEKRAKEFMAMHNQDGSVAAAWERLSSVVKGDDDMVGLAKEIKKTYKITEDTPQGERMEKMMTMLQEKNINKIADNIGNKFSGDGGVQKILKTIQPGFKQGSKTKKDEKKPKEKKEYKTTNKNDKTDKKENSEKKHTKETKEKKAKSKKSDKNLERKDSEKSTNTIKQKSNDKILNNLEDAPSCKIEKSKTNKNSHDYKNAESDCNVPVNDNNNPSDDIEEKKIQFSRFQDSVNFDTTKNQIRGEIGENILPINSHSSNIKQSRGDADDELSPSQNPPTPNKQKRGDTGETLPLTNNPSHKSRQGRGETRENLSLQDQGDESHNSFPGRGSLPEKEIRTDDAKIPEDKQRSEPTGRVKSKEKHWTGEGYDFGNKEPMGPPSEKSEGKLGKLSKDLPLFSLLSSREERTKDNTQKKAKVSRRVARGDTGSIDNMMESLQDHGGWNAARGRK